MNMHCFKVLPVVMLTLGIAASTEGVAQQVTEVIPYSTPLGSGPHKVIPTMDPELPGYTIYAAQDLARRGGSGLPIVAWAEGGCMDNGTRFRWFLSEIASHGFLVVAIGGIGPPEEQIWLPPPPGPPTMPDIGSFPPPPTRTVQLNQAIDWAIAENSRAGSRYFGRLDTTKVAVMGMSCGGVQAMGATLSDPRVSTTVMWNMGLFADPAINATAGGGPLTRSDLARLRGSVAYISGDESDIAFENANEDFKRLPRDIPAFRAYRRNTPHDGTYGEHDGGDFGRVAVAWLNWKLKADKKAARLFTGVDCGLCRDSNWVTRQQNLR